MSMFNQFYRKSYEERYRILKESGWLRNKAAKLDYEKADHMIENYLFNYELPLGVALNFKINQKEYIIPMVTEEPSVIAAASNGGKRLGNIETKMESRHIVGQIILTNLSDLDEAENSLKLEFPTLLEKAKSVSKNMVKRGGGPLYFRTEQFFDEVSSYLTLYLAFDPCDAMGANAINTVLEALTEDVEKITGGTALMSILSNNGAESIASAFVEVPVESLHRHRNEAELIAERIVQASHYAQVDPYRAVTHNKGIMNGVEAILLATGNDTRAVSASVHAFASIKGQYKGLSQWNLSKDKTKLIGRLELPLQVATVGGSISTHPMARWSLDLLKNPSAKELSQIIVAVGLAQNFAALRALITDGIQKGHMALHARNLAMQVGAKKDEIALVVKELRKHQTMNSTLAKEILNNIRS